MNRQARGFSWILVAALGVASLLAWPVQADQPLPPTDGEQVIVLYGGIQVEARISIYGGALKSWLVLDPQFHQAQRKEPATATRPPAGKWQEGPLDLVTTWSPAFYPLSLNLVDFQGPEVVRHRQDRPGDPPLRGDFWTVFGTDPRFTVVEATPTSVRMVWPDPATDDSPVFLERSYHLMPDYRLEAQVRIVNLGTEPVSGQVRLLIPAWEAPDTASGGCGQSMFSAPPDLLEAVCYQAGSLEKKNRQKLLEQPDFPGSGPAVFGGINRRYFLVAVVPGPDLPSQCMARADRNGVVNTMLQWGDTEGKAFVVKPAPGACLPDYVLPTGRFAGRMPCREAARILGVSGEEGIAELDRVQAGDSPEAVQAKAALMARRQRTFAFTAFIGPKDFDALKAAGTHLDDTIDFWVLGFLAKPMLWLMRLSYALIPSWGVAILFLTLVVRLLTLWPTWKSMVSMRRMAALKPRIDALREKFKDDPARLNKETMDLYKREKVNPMGGCLPMLLQMPIWIALYRTIYGAVDLYQAPLFLWIRDLSSHDPYFVMPLLLGVLTFLQQKMTPTAGDPAQARMMLWMMPIMFTVFMLFLPSGLVFYILVNTVLGIGQQWYMNRNLRPATVART